MGEVSHLTTPATAAFAEAARLATQASFIDPHCTKAQSLLGCLYLCGFGVPRCFEQSHEHFERAYRTGDASAAASLAALARHEHQWTAYKEARACAGSVAAIGLTSYAVVESSSNAARLAYLTFHLEGQTSKPRELLRLANRKEQGAKAIEDLHGALVTS